MELSGKLIDIVKMVDRCSPRPNFYSFVMSEREMFLFDKTIRNSKVYLEFGAGGSTLRTLQNSQAKIYSVDLREKVMKHYHDTHHKCKRPLNTPYEFVL